jgi:hypothetical protein
MFSTGCKSTSLPPCVVQPRPFGVLPLKWNTSYGAYYNGFVINDGGSYAPQMPWYMARYCDSKLAVDPQDSVGHLEKLISVPIAAPSGANVYESEREQTRIIRRQSCGARRVGAIFRGALHWLCLFGELAAEPLVAFRLRARSRSTCMVVSLPVLIAAGWLSDWVGRKPPMLLASMGGLIGALPVLA